MSGNGKIKKCPFCGSVVSPNASKCKHCGKKITDSPGLPLAGEEMIPEENSLSGKGSNKFLRWAALILGVIVIVVYTYRGKKEVPQPQAPESAQQEIEDTVRPDTTQTNDTSQSKQSTVLPETSKTNQGIFEKAKEEPVRVQQQHLEDSLWMEKQLQFVKQQQAAILSTGNLFVGMKQCRICHISEKIGNQFAVWQKSKHAKAYQVLLTPAAVEIATTKGVTSSANESPVCLRCHSIVQAIVQDGLKPENVFDVKDGVQCESCHGAGSSYRNILKMKDKQQAIASGLTPYHDAQAIEAQCRTCHNDGSPTFKGFDFASMWEQIKHPVLKN